MSRFQHIDIDQAKEYLESGAVVFLDIRDGMSREEGFIDPSVHLTDETA